MVHALNRRAPSLGRSTAFAISALLVLPPAAPAHLQRDAPAALLAAARTVSRDLAAIRELEWHRAVDFQLSDRETIQRYARASLEREMTAAEWSGYQALLVHCGLLPVEVELQDLVVRLYAEQVAGYYDPDQKTFYLADWLPRLLQRAVVAHEVTHALQDQHFDLVRWMDAVSPTDDAALARAAVVEGDAMAAMLAYLLAPTGMGPQDLPDVSELLTGNAAAIGQGFPTFSTAPPALQRLLLFPYVEGSTFVMTALRRGGWPAVDALYQDPPASTEQILHPERYWESRDEPRPPETPRLPEGSLIAEGSWGELGIQLILAAALGDTARAAAAARGWDGDRYALYGAEDAANVFAWTTVWDTPENAERFARVYAEASALRFRGPARMTTASGSFSYETPARTIRVRRDGGRVEILELDRSHPRR